MAKYYCESKKYHNVIFATKDKVHRVQSKDLRKRRANSVKKNTIAVLRQIRKLYTFRCSPNTCYDLQCPAARIR